MMKRHCLKALLCVLLCLAFSLLAVSCGGEDLPSAGGTKEASGAQGGERTEEPTGEYTSVGTTDGWSQDYK